MIHMHRTCGVDELDYVKKSIIQIVMQQGFSAHIKHVTRVKSYAPAVNHVVFDVYVKPA